jgi:hypothetical protein
MLRRGATKLAHLTKQWLYPISVEGVPIAASKLKKALQREHRDEHQNYCREE